jgi:hypothetical protein
MDVRSVVAAMRRRVCSAAAGATLVALFIASREVTAAGPCERLRRLTLADAATVTDARPSRQTPRRSRSTRILSRVRTIAPTADSDIKVEV